MAHVPREVIDRLWAASHGSWQGLQYALQNGGIAVTGMGEHLTDRLQKIVNDNESSGEPFPDSAGQLYTVLNHTLDAQGSHHSASR